MQNQRISFAAAGSRDLRNIPSEQQERFRKVFERLSSINGKAFDITLHTGHSEGSDFLAEDTYTGPVMSYVPWQSYNEFHVSTNGNVDIILYQADRLSEFSVDRVHPNAHQLSPGARKIAARTFLELSGSPGEDGSYSDSVSALFALAPEGKMGTEAAESMRIAKLAGIPVYNIGTDAGYRDAMAALDTMEEGRVPDEMEKAGEGFRHLVSMWKGEMDAHDKGNLDLGEGDTGMERTLSLVILCSPDRNGLMAAAAPRRDGSGSEIIYLRVTDGSGNAVRNQPFSRGMEVTLRGRVRKASGLFIMDTPRSWIPRGEDGKAATRPVSRTDLEVFDKILRAAENENGMAERNRAGDLAVADSILSTLPVIETPDGKPRIRIAFDASRSWQAFRDDKGHLTEKGLYAKNIGRVIASFAERHPDVEVVIGYPETSELAAAFSSGTLPETRALNDIPNLVMKPYIPWKTFQPANRGVDVPSETAYFDGKARALYMRERGVSAEPPQSARGFIASTISAYAGEDFMDPSVFVIASPYFNEREDRASYDLPRLGYLGGAEVFNITHKEGRERLSETLSRLDSMTTEEISAYLGKHVAERERNRDERLSMRELPMAMRNIRGTEGDRKDITSFTDADAFLSMDAETPIVYKGVSFRSARSAYEASRCRNDADRALFSSLDAHEAKRIGMVLGTDKAPEGFRDVEIIPKEEFAGLREGIMKEIQAIKFSDPELQKALLSTGNAKLLNSNSVKDTYWGISEGTGSNRLGNILMELRASLRDKTDPGKALGNAEEEKTLSDTDFIARMRENRMRLMDSRPKVPDREPQRRQKIDGKTRRINPVSFAGLGFAHWSPTVSRRISDRVTDKMHDGFGTFLTSGPMDFDRFSALAVLAYTAPEDFRHVSYSIGYSDDGVRNDSRSSILLDNAKAAYARAAKAAGRNPEPLIPEGRAKAAVSRFMDSFSYGGFIAAASGSPDIDAKWNAADTVKRIFSSIASENNETRLFSDLSELYRDPVRLVRERSRDTGGGEILTVLLDSSPDAREALEKASREAAAKAYRDLAESLIPGKGGDTELSVLASSVSYMTLPECTRNDLASPSGALGSTIGEDALSSFSKATAEAGKTILTAVEKRIADDEDIRRSLIVAKGTFEEVSRPELGFQSAAKALLSAYTGDEKGVNEHTKEAVSAIGEKESGLLSAIGAAAAAFSGTGFRKDELLHEDMGPIYRNEERTRVLESIIDALGIKADVFTLEQRSGKPTIKRASLTIAGGPASGVFDPNGSLPKDLPHMPDDSFESALGMIRTELEKAGISTSFNEIDDLGLRESADTEADEERIAREEADGDARSSAPTASPVVAFPDAFDRLDRYAQYKTYREEDPMPDKEGQDTPSAIYMFEERNAGVVKAADTVKVYAGDKNATEAVMKALDDLVLLVSEGNKYIDLKEVCPFIPSILGEGDNAFEPTPEMVSEVWRAVKKDRQIEFISRSLPEQSIAEIGNRIERCNDAERVVPYSFQETFILLSEYPSMGHYLKAYTERAKEIGTKEGFERLAYFPGTITLDYTAGKPGKDGAENIPPSFKISYDWSERGVPVYTEKDMRKMEDAIQKNITGFKGAGEIAESIIRQSKLPEMNTLYPASWLEKESVRLTKEFFSSLPNEAVKALSDVPPEKWPVSGKDSRPLEKETLQMLGISGEKEKTKAPKARDTGGMER